MQLSRTVCAYPELETDCREVVRVHIATILGVRDHLGGRVVNEWRLELTVVFFVPVLWLLRLGVRNCQWVLRVANFFAGEIPALTAVSLCRGTGSATHRT